MAKVPQIRFKGFDGEWEKKNISCLANRFDNLRIPIKESLREKGETPYYGANGIQDYVSGYTHDGEFILIAEDGASDLVNYPVQYVFGKVWVNNHAHVLQGKKGVAQTLFLKYSINSANLVPYLVGGGRSKLNSETLMGLPLTVSTYIFEQKEIASYFYSLDTLISSRQKELQKLKAIKNALLEHLFPKNGKTNPQVRFRGFVDDWVIKSFTELTYLSGKKNCDNLPLESYSVTNDNGFMPQLEKFENGGTMSLADKSMYSIVSPLSFAYNPARIDIGSLGYYDGKKDVIISSLYIVFKTTDDCYDYFLNHWFKTHHFNKLVKSHQEGGVRLYFFYDKLQSCNCALPSVEEQKKIANILSSLDRLITARAAQITKLQNLKRGMLERMFVNE